MADEKQFTQRDKKGWYSPTKNERWMKITLDDMPGRIFLLERRNVQGVNAGLVKAAAITEIPRDQKETITTLTPKK